MKEQIDRKVEERVYQFESPPCILCDNAEFLPLAGKDRYGLYAPTVICMQCGLVQARPRMTQESYTAFYNCEYRKLYAAEPAPPDTFFQKQHQSGQYIYEYLLAHCVIDPSGRDFKALEVGCGAGGILKAFQDKGWQVKGVDIGEEYLEYGRAEHGLDLVAGDLSSVPEDYDPHVVIYSHVLEHILQPKDEFALLREVLPDTGCLYVEVPGIKYYRVNYSMNLLNYLQNAHVAHYSLRTLVNMLASCGYELVAGDERIRSVFRKMRSPRTDRSPVESDYDSVLRYIRLTENLCRWLPFNPFPWPSILWVTLYRLLRTLGVHSCCKSLLTLWRTWRERAPASPGK